MDNLRWFGLYAAEKMPDVIVHLGDHWDMPSLSSYDKGKRAMEGRRYRADVQAGNDGMALLNAGIEEGIAKTRRGKRGIWRPRRILLRGNHEQRIIRATEMDAALDGTIGYDDLESPGWEVYDFLEVVDADGVVYCLSPSSRVLTADLRWVDLGNVGVGDRLLAFDENGAPRKFCESIVLAADPTVVPTSLVRLSDGRHIVATPDHRWLARRYGSTGWKWVHTRDLVAGTELCQPFEVWDEDLSYEAGYVAGILDGEGHISKPNCAQGGIQVGFSQKHGHVLDRTLQILDSWGVPYSAKARGDGVVGVRIRGTSSKKLELLGRVDACRLIDKFRPEMLGRVQQVNPVFVEAVEGNGHDEVVQIATTSGTLIADGIAHHNCHYFQNRGTGKPLGGMAMTRLKQLGHTFIQGHQQTLEVATRFVLDKQQWGIVAGAAYLHDEDYLGYQGNHHWRGILRLASVKDGSFDPMFISLDSLCRRYEGMSLSRFMERYS